MGRGQNEWFWELYVIYMCFQWVPQHEASSFLPLWPSIVARRAWPASTFGEKWRSWTGSRRQPPTSAALNGEITVLIFFSKKIWKIQGFKLKERTFQLIGHATWSSAHLHYIYIIYIYKYIETKTISYNRCRETSHRYAISIVYAPRKGPSSPLSGTGWRGARCRGLKGENSPQKRNKSCSLILLGWLLGRTICTKFRRTSNSLPRWIKSQDVQFDFVVAFTDHSHGLKDS